MTNRMYTDRELVYRPWEQQIEDLSVRDIAPIWGMSKTQTALYLSEVKADRYEITLEMRRQVRRALERGEVWQR